ncbi:MAG TPA: 30S ribosomal protein S18 [Planctomycetota bacterium]|jgi:small subunit ribosomal protein S18|nr:30S ribosomal protein S18 [Planctomycetota bacterium]
MIPDPKTRSGASDVVDFAADVEVPPEATPLARGGKGFKRFRERRRCRFCADRVDTPDYKDIGRLQKLLSNQGRIYSRKRSGNCARHQRLVKLALKRARFVSLLPYLA